MEKKKQINLLLPRTFGWFVKNYGRVPLPWCLEIKLNEKRKKKKTWLIFIYKQIKLSKWNILKRLKQKFATKFFASPLPQENTLAVPISVIKMESQ
jgi:hypothetical protein